MAVKDIRSNIQQNLAMNANITTDTTTSGSIIDTANFELGLMFATLIPVFSDGSYELRLFESSDSGMSGAVQITGDKLIGVPPTLTAVTAAGAALSTVGVISNLRYVQARIVSTSTSSGARVVIVVSQKEETLPV